MADLKNKYDTAKSDRQKHVDAVLNSSLRKKIVVAGPGTGKTYLFKEILKNKKNTLTLTFVNSLVEDLSLELYGLSDVKTLHSFARSALAGTAKNIKIFPKLSEVIKEDASILLNKEIDFDHIFHNRNDDNEHIKFYESRRHYYDEHFGYSDIIFSIVKHFESKKDSIPVYDQVVVDEFQDFNKLEVSLIELLSEKSPILLAGDDDQALYDFKSASAEHIRQRHGNANSNYTSFVLPYCSRCTRVIVEAANDIIKAATDKKYLDGRIKKPYQYFEDENKDKESDQNQKVIYCQLFAKQIPWFISEQISKIAYDVKGEFSVLVITPTKVQSGEIINALKNKGFKNIEHLVRKEEKGPTLLDGLKILLEDKKSNLGWRIVCKKLLSGNDFDNLIKKTRKEPAENIVDILDTNCKKEVIRMLKGLSAIRDGKVVDKNELDWVLQKVGINPLEISKNLLNEEIISSVNRFGHPGLRKIPIKATTIQSSKGLAADYVFIAYFDDLYFIKDKDKNKISNQDICNFIVALTRARRKVYLVSSNKKEPTFLKWINKDRIEIV